MKIIEISETSESELDSVQQVIRRKKKSHNLSINAMDEELRKSMR
jgi:hypothetical protein